MGTLELVADTKEEKMMLSEKVAIENSIKECTEKNMVLEKEAEKFEHLASTINSEPFIELKQMIKEAIKTYTDKEDVKEMKKKVKNFDAISEMENLLVEYKELAEENRQNIIANQQDIERMKNKIDEINSKLKNHQIPMFTEGDGEGAEQ